MAEYSKQFVSLDLETTGFDFRDGRIIEAAGIRGELYFDKSAKKIKVKFEDEFTALINPEIETPRAVLQLTGIKQKELDEAPVWGEVKLKFESFIHDEMIIGQNIDFDLGFLENQGVSLKNKAADTLELTQTLLPTVASHSLSYVANELGVEIGVSHRALEDSKTTALVMAETLNQFLLLPVNLQTQIKSFFKNSEVGIAQVLVDLPDIQAEGVSIQRPLVFSLQPEKVDLTFADKTIYSLPLSFSRHQEWLSHMAAREKGLAVGVSHPIYLDAAPASQRIVSPHRALCRKRFERLLTRDNLSVRAYKLLSKVLIFQHYFDSLDLGLARFTPQEREILSRIKVTPGVCKTHKCPYYSSLKFSDKQAYFGDISALFALVFEWGVDFSGLKALLFDLSAVEESLLLASSELWSLKKIREILGRIYPLDTSGTSFFEESIKEAQGLANELDLFFGILHLVFLKKDGEFSENLALDQNSRANQRFEKLVGPAKKLSGKLGNFVKYLENQILVESGEAEVELRALQAKLDGFQKFIEEVFAQPKEEKIYWLKFNSQWVDLNSAPRDLSLAMQIFSEKVSTLSLLDTELPKLSWQYFQTRLGLEAYQEEVVKISKKTAPIETQLIEGEFVPENLSAILSEERSSIVVVPNENQLSKFFEDFASRSSVAERLVSHKHSGAIGVVRKKLSQAVSESRPFVFLLTLNAALRFYNEFPEADDLYFQKIPFEAPGQSGPARKIHSFRNDFLENTLPRALRLLNIVLTRFAKERHGEKNQRVFFGDRRILTGYDQQFLNYLKDVSDFDLKFGQQ